MSGTIDRRVRTLEGRARDRTRGFVVWVDDPFDDCAVERALAEHEAAGGRFPVVVAPRPVPLDEWMARCRAQFSERSR